MDIEIIVITGTKIRKVNGDAIWKDKHILSHTVISTSDDIKSAKKEALRMAKLLIKEI